MWDAVRRFQRLAGTAIAGVLVFSPVYPMPTVVAGPMNLRRYQSKRDFSATAEPAGELRQTDTSGRRRFVVQKHHARRLHYDFRLEMDGVLKSWAVPKGPSLDPSVRRLAVETEDHPMEYADFEGVIAAGQYGAGRVIVWDHGTWTPDEDVDIDLEAGKLHFTLQGQRLKGSWRLVRTRRSGKQPQWLLMKSDDEYADSEHDITADFTTSVVSSQTLDELGQSPPSFIEPKLPTLVAISPTGDQWIHELKLDGYRMQAHWTDGEFRLMTRSGKNWTDRYPEVANMLSGLNFDGTVIDGELVALDAHGRSDFAALQYQANFESQATLAFFAFDLLFLRGADLRKLSLLDRKRKLAGLLQREDVKAATRIQFLDHLVGDPKVLLRQCEKLGLEGVVSKRIDRPYASGRAQDWLKVKLRARESFLVGGYEISDGGTLSSLLLGFWDGMELKFAGRVGTGWNQLIAEQLVGELSGYKSNRSPFAESVPHRKRGGKVRRHWATPRLVVEVDFAGWTDGNVLRQASFSRIERGVAADDVTKKTVKPDIDAEPDQIETKPTPEASRRSATMTVDFASGLTSPDRVLFPHDQITKADVAAYLYQVGQWMLPHIENRPLSFVRCPDGIDSEAYFQRHPRTGFPNEISRLVVASEEESLLSIANMAGLLATAQISAIELHPWGCRTDKIEKPDRMIVDLDPDLALPWPVVVEAAELVREQLMQAGLQSFLKTTGGKGLHLVVPIVRRYGWSPVFEFSKLLAGALEKQHPKLFVATMSKAKRKGKVFVDYHRNRKGSTAVAAYSLRARKSAPISTPIGWEELPNIVPDQFTIKTVPDRLRQLRSDPWQGIQELRQSLPKGRSS